MRSSPSQPKDSIGHHKIQPVAWQRRTGRAWACVLVMLIGLGVCAAGAKLDGAGGGLLIIVGLGLGMAGIQGALVYGTKPWTWSRRR